MALFVDTVNMPYHHGQLREALVDAADALARAGGPERVVLRAATRAAGVSHNAAYRHFEDRDALLQVVCDRCMDRLSSLMEARLAEVGGGDPVEDAWARLEATGRAYIDFALSEPGWFRTAFGVPQFDPGPKEPVPGGPSPYDILGQALDRLVTVGAVTPQRRAGAEFPAWAAVHGISNLLLDGPLRALGTPAQEEVVKLVLDSVRRSLAATPSQGR